jgi:hypothetical protein
MAMLSRAQGPSVDQWLVQEFTILGIHFQNWMLVDAGIVLAAVLIAWLQGRGRTHAQ